MKQRKPKAAGSETPRPPIKPLEPRDLTRAVGGHAEGGIGDQPSQLHLAP